MKKRMLVLLLCVLLVVLGACGKAPQDTDKPQDTPPSTTTAAPVTTTKAPYDRLLAATEQDAQAAAICAAIDGQDFTTAYTLLKEWDNPLKQALLAQFVFVPTTIRATIHSDKSDMHFSTELTYDKQGNPLKHVHTDKGNKTETVYTYDDNGRLTKEIAASDSYTRTVTYTYDAAGRLTRKHHATENTFEDVIRRDETTYTYAYDEKGNLAEEKRVSSYSNGGGEEVTTTYTYNESGKETLKKITFKDGGWDQVETSYHENGAVYQVRKRNSSVLGTRVTEYDEQGRLLREWTEKGTNGPLITLENTYDEQGRLVKTTRSSGADYYTYDGDGNLIEESNGVDRVVYTYDESGNCLSQTRLSLTDEVTWARVGTYDAKGGLLTDTITYSSGRTASTANAYDADGNRITQTYEDFSSETGDAITITETVAWTLFYYPDGVPEVVEEELYSLTIPPNAA